MGFSIFDIPTNIIGRVLNQYVPTSAVDSFMAFLSVIHNVGDFDRACTDIWKNGGKNFKISAKDLNLVALPLAQLIITSHSDRLPDDKEFENLMTWIADQNSDQLASYILDVFKNTFMGDISNNDTRDKLFVAKGILDYIKSQPDFESKKRLYDSVFKPFFTKWNVDWDSMPDYRHGLEIANKKYGEVFRNATFDGRDALG